MKTSDTIVAPATGHGGAIAVVRLSGGDSFAIVDRVFRSPSGRMVSDAEGYTILFGTVRNATQDIDDVLVSVFRAPHSYTGENSVEISCHASDYIRDAIIHALTEVGARMAGAGEFTVRAFLNGKMDLSQAEAVADLIASGSEADHKIALNQMRGGFARELAVLRAELLQVTSLLELELDFSEEDVEFADRTRMKELLNEIGAHISSLKESFRVGNAIKRGIQVAIVGRPNVGKSTLLNRLLGEDKAMVSDIAGTTRDVIEDTAVIGGVLFRFMDTAGLRSTDDVLEQMGIDRTLNAISKADVVLNLVDVISEATSVEGDNVIRVVNKADITGSPVGRIDNNSVALSAKTGEGIDTLREMLRSKVDTSLLDSGGSVVSNLRHYEALSQALVAVDESLRGLSTGVTADMLSESVRQVLYSLGTITGEITTDELLGNIFSKFCIGK